MVEDGGRVLEDRAGDFTIMLANKAFAVVMWAGAAILLAELYNAIYMDNAILSPFIVVPDCVGIGIAVWLGIEMWRAK